MKIIEKKNSYTFKIKPSEKFLDNFYKNIYFKNDKNFSYKKNKTELSYYSIEAKIKIYLIQKNLNNHKLHTKTSLDLGCGTGHFVNEISKKFKIVDGVDFNTSQIPKKLIKKNIFYSQNPNLFIKNKLNYDFIFLNNILEHSLNPEKILKKIHKNSKKNSYLIVTIPNDFSEIQKKTFSLVKKKYWVKYPEHLFYFNKTKFKNLIKNKYNIIDAIADFPIELFLFFKETDYVSYPNKGKLCHEIRCKSIINLYKKLKIDGLYSLQKKIFDINIGRNNIFLLKKI